MMSPEFKKFYRALIEQMFWRKPTPTQVLLGKALYDEAAVTISHWASRNDMVAVVTDKLGRFMLLDVPVSQCELLAGSEYAFVTPAAVTVTPEPRSGVTE